MSEETTSWQLTPSFAWGRELFRGSMLGLGVVFVLLLFQKYDPAFEMIDDDAVSSWQPIFTDFVNQLGEGRLPVWSDHTSCGYPLLGWPQPSFVYPPMWLAHGFCRLIGFDAGEFYIATLIHVFLAAVASFVYLRRFDVHPLAAGAASLGASLSGILLGLGSCWPTYIFTAAYWPMAFLAVEEIRSRGSWSWTLFLGWLGGMAFLYADLMLMVKFTMLVGFYFLLRLDRASAGRMVLSAAIASAIALVVGVGQWLTSYELIRASARMSLGSIDFYTAPPLLWVGFLFPFLQLPWEAFPFSAERAAGGFFVGPCAILGLIFALRWYRRLEGPHRALLVLLPIYLVLAVGSHWPPNEWIQRLPIFSAIRWPFRWMFEASTVLALLSGFGLHLADRDLKAGRETRTLFAFIAAMAVAVVMKAAAPLGADRLVFGMRGVWTAGLIAVWMTARRQSERPSSSFLSVVFVWTAIGMFANIPVAQSTRMARMTRLVDQPLTVGRDTTHRILFLARHSELVSAQKEGNLSRLFPHRFGTRSVLGYVYRPPSQAWMTGFELDGLIYEKEPDLARRFLGPDSTILSTLRIGHVVVFKTNKVLDDACAANPNLKLEDESEFYRIYRHDGFQAPAFLVESLKRQESPEDVIDLGLRVNLPKEGLVGADFEGPTRFSGIGEVRGFREHHGQIAMKVTSRDDGFLVVTTTFFPRWRATVDGEPVAIVPVNGSFMGVRIPAGEHVVEFVYWPTDHVALLGVSAIAWIVTTGGIYLVGRRKGRRT